MDTVSKQDWFQCDDFIFRLFMYVFGIKGRGEASIMQDGTVDLQHGNEVV
jgi:hypothetical protein